MANKIFQKDQPVVYANGIYIVLYSNHTTTKLIGKEEKIKRFEFTNPETGERESIETNTIYCETDSMFLKELKKDFEQSTEIKIEGQHDTIH